MERRAAPCIFEAAISSSMTLIRVTEFCCDGRNVVWRESVTEAVLFKLLIFERDDETIRSERTHTRNGSASDS